MDFIERLGDVITQKGKEAADKAREAAEIARLRSQISTCEEVIKKNYLEIGRQYYERYGRTGTEEAVSGSSENPFAKQCMAIENAGRGVERLQEKIRKIKGL